MSFILDNYLEIFAAVGAVVTAATAVAALTPSKRDDEIVGKIAKVVNFLSLRLTK